MSKIILISFVNAFVLTGVGLWGYIAVKSPTALIPVGFGIALILCSLVLKYKPSLTKIVAHVAVFLVIIILVALLGMRLPKSLETGGLGLLRVLIMSVSCGFTLFSFVKHFKDNRQAMKKKP